MLNSLLNIVRGDEVGKNPDNWYFDNFGEPAIYALIGFLVVFAGIVIIIAVIWLVGFIMRKTNNFEFLTKKRTKKVIKEQVDVQQTVDDNQTDEIPDEVKAAIIAAIMAYYQEKEEKCQFTVKRIKRI
jgi:Na+-transporting methylmalonyl-CoA/oxaloacetate decarboxylase gamma subunit